MDAAGTKSPHALSKPTKRVEDENRGFMVTVTSSTEGTSFTTLHSSRPEVERMEMLKCQEAGMGKN